ncbi:glyoxalase [Tenacibaculum discolor]|uniref:Glyoxalase n=1 Tax=Tenacibaculum discolor TaxID=361581 RepID=A0A2G1BSX0_9FLAO|nr:glyoxalase [Tenacibaculum discolor]MDP2542525.1 glyoxalase [Tenacibaculum discolor]PHN97098.1 glyoxalase [Tenacibaculum discolor]PHN99513.1 glyoxalase [Rhodobacteraceae bacterium 4F10]
MTLNEIEIKTTDIKPVKAFYKNIMELPTTQIDNKSICVKAGKSYLKFIEDSEKNLPAYHLAFNIPKNKLQEAINWSTNKFEFIKKENEEFITNFENWNAYSVYFFDAVGNILEFIARHDLDNATTTQFNSNQILNISEFGIVKDQPDVYGKYLIDTYGLHIFEKNHNSETFTAIGDDNGLLIIVKTNRNWYPTQTPSKASWANIKLSNSGTETILKIRE